MTDNTLYPQVLREEIKRTFYKAVVAHHKHDKIMQMKRKFMNNG